MSDNIQTISLTKLGIIQPISPAISELVKYIQYYQIYQVQAMISTLSDTINLAVMQHAISI